MRISKDMDVAQLDDLCDGGMEPNDLKYFVEALVASEYVETAEIPPSVFEELKMGAVIKGMVEDGLLREVMPIVE